MQVKSNKNTFVSKTAFIVLHNEEWYEKQKVAGKVVAGALSLLENLVKEKSTLTLLEMNKLAEEYIESHGCQCTFKGYKNFPNGVCISVDRIHNNMPNKNQYQMVHGIPKDGETLYDGCIVKFDLGATYKCAIADSAISCIYGEPREQQHIDLLKDTSDALMKGIASIKVGEHIGVIGNAIYNHGLSKNRGVIVKFGGHGLGWSKPHDFPFIANKANINDGIVIREGLSIAIEPMLTLDDNITTFIGDDGWTVYTRCPSAHWEHSLFVHKDHVEIMTLRENEK